MPSWPVLLSEWSAAYNANGGAMPTTWVDVTNRSLTSDSVKRGRQYELDQVQAGELSATLRNDDAALDPTNTAGPFAGKIAPYQPYRLRVQYPPTPNLLTYLQATGGEGYGAGLIPSSFGVHSATDSTGGQIVIPGDAWDGLNVFQFSVASNVGAGSRIGTLDASVSPGATYTLQLRARCATAGATAIVKPVIAFYGSTAGAGPSHFKYGSVVNLTGTGWTYITVTVTAPASCYGLTAGLSTGGAAGVAYSLQMDGIQLERGSTASPWQAPGTWYPLFSGFVERWPSAWKEAGGYGTVQPTATDALALLSQVNLSDSLTEEINAHNPRFLFKLNDPQDSASAADATGNFPSAPVENSKYGTGSLTFGTQITSATAGGAFTGSSDTVMTLANPWAGLNAISPASFISLDRVGIVGPANPSGTWSRMFAFRCTTQPSAGSVIWSAFGKGGGYGNPVMNWSIVPVGSGHQIKLTISGPTTTHTDFFPAGQSEIADSNWHLVIASYSHANATLMISLDGVTTTWANFNTALEPVGLVCDNLGTWADKTTGYGAVFNYAGDLAFACEWPTALTSDDMGNLYSAWRSACAGESAGARYSRILRYAGYAGAANVATGLTTNMGPATDIDGSDALTALQNVVTTENGEHFVGADGTLTFRGRDARYNALTPVYTFGENGAGGEIPYEDLQLDFDSTHLANDATITQNGTSQTFYAKDATSIANFFDRTFTRTVNAEDPNECQDAANYLVSRYRNPLTRVASLTLNPAANPAIWPACLSLELGMRIRVMRRPFNCPPITLDVFIEQISWDIDDKGGVSLVIQCSPADVTPYALVAAWHSTLYAAKAAGTYGFPVGPMDGNNSLALGAEVYPGTQLVIDPGLSTQETLTVASVGATTAGSWTNGTITMTTASKYAHAAGAVITEPLPTGVTNPATWDNSAVIDSIALSY